MALVDALLRAQSGYRSDVAALTKELQRSDVYAALQAGSGLPAVPTKLERGVSVALHHLSSGDGTVWIPLFSSVELLRQTGERLGWQTDEGPLRFIAFKWDEAIAGMFGDALQTGQATGIVFDAGSRSELALKASEVLSLSRGEPVPLVAYSAEQPARGGEEVFMGEPATAPSAELLEAIRSTLEGEGAVKSYRLRQLYMPERDVMPHLILDIESSASEPERRRISQRVGEAIKGIVLAPPGYLDVAFNFNQRDP